MKIWNLFFWWIAERRKETKGQNLVALLLLPLFISAYESWKNDTCSWSEQKPHGPHCWFMCARAHGQKAASSTRNNCPNTRHGWCELIELAADLRIICWHRPGTSLCTGLFVFLLRTCLKFKRAVHGCILLEIKNCVVCFFLVLGENLMTQIIQSAFYHPTRDIFLFRHLFSFQLWFRIRSFPADVALIIRSALTFKNK